MPRLPMMPALQNSRSIGVPLSFCAIAASCRRFVTSSGYSAFAPRSVPITFQPSSAYWRASSLPRPRPVPVISAVGMSVELADTRQQPADAARVSAIRLAVGAQQIAFFRGDLLPDREYRAHQDQGGEQRRHEQGIPGEHRDQREEDRIA